MSTPLVAIVTPVYNGEAYLAETMDSVQAQTWPNLVHVILDNCSTDATPEIIDRYRNGRVPLLAFRNDTLLDFARDNWNAAFEHVPAEAIYTRLLCADDTITPESIEEMVEVAETDPEIGVIGCLHDCAGEIADFFWPKDQTVFDGCDALRKIFLREGVMMPVQMMMRKSVADRRKPLFQGPLKGGYDMDAMLDLLKSSKFGFVHKSLGFTRVHEQSTTATKFGPATRAWTADGLHFLTAHGPAAFGDRYEEQLRRFQRYYVRRILSWRKADGGNHALSLHMEALKTAGWSCGPSRIADALLDWCLIKLGVRRNWTGYPGWQ